VASSQGHNPSAFPPEKVVDTNFTGSWVGLRVGLYGCGKFRPHRH